MNGFGQTVRAGESIARSVALQLSIALQPFDPPPHWSHHPAGLAGIQREFCIDNSLVRIHFIIVMIRRTGLAPWEYASCTCSWIPPASHQRDTSLLTTYWSESDDLVDRPRAMGVLTPPPVARQQGGEANAYDLIYYTCSPPTPISRRQPRANGA